MTQTLHRHVYENGLVLVAEPMRSLESAAFTFLVPAGCCHDPADKQGLASMVCELALRGAGARDSRRFVEDLENLGVERHESVAVEYSNFGAAMLASSLEAALEIYADLLMRPHLPADQLEAGRLVAIQELRGIEDEPSQKVIIELKRRCYPEPWGRSSHGRLEGLEAITIEDILAQYEQLYRPNEAILGVAGNIDWPRLRNRVGELFGGWRRKEVAEPAEVARKTQHTHLEYESNQTQIGIAYPSIPYRDPNYFRAWGAIGVLSGGMSSRLFTEVREKRGLCYSVSASHHTQRDRASVLCYAGTSAERAQETLDVTLAELARLKDGVQPDELARLKARIKSGLIMQQESSSSRSGAIARDWRHLGRVRTLDEIGVLVDDLSCESINAYLAQDPPRDFVVVTMGPSPLEVSVGV